MAASPAGTTRFVVSGGSGDCSDWLHACDLPTALDDAASGTAIWVASGYGAALQRRPGRRLHAGAGVAVYGGFEGNEPPVRPATRPPTPPS